MYTNRSIIARNRFEEIGVQLQERSDTWEQAAARFDKSCMLCCMHQSAASDCDACPIRAAFLAKEGWLGHPKDYLWKVKAELALA